LENCRFVIDFPDLLRIMAFHLATLNYIDSVAKPLPNRKGKPWEGNRSPIAR
jgi:hypothetical protein